MRKYASLINMYTCSRFAVWKDFLLLVVFDISLKKMLSYHYSILASEGCNSVYLIVNFTADLFVIGMEGDFVATF